jgi:hypothetical protein
MLVVDVREGANLDRDSLFRVSQPVNRLDVHPMGDVEVSSTCRMVSSATNPFGGAHSSTRTHRPEELEALLLQALDRRKELLLAFIATDREQHVALRAG